MTQQLILRQYLLQRPEPLVVEFHDPACDYPYCEAMAAPDVDQEQDSETLRAVRHIGRWGGLGLLIGNAIAFSIDPHGAWLALTAVFVGVR